MFNNRGITVVSRQSHNRCKSVARSKNSFNNIFFYNDCSPVKKQIHRKDKELHQIVDRLMVL